MRKRVCIISAALCMALAVTACGGRKDVSYDSGSDAAGADGTDSTASDNAGAAESGGLLAEQLGIPESTQVDIQADGTNIKKITIDDAEIDVPDKDRMYTKSYRMGILTEETKEEIVKTFLNAEDGIYDYPEEMFNANDTDRDAIEQIFEEGAPDPDYTGTYFIGKIDKVPYVVRFMDTSWSTDEVFVVSRACQDEIPEEMQNKQASSVTYYDYDPDELYGDQSGNDEDSADKEADNACGMDPEQAGRRAQEYMDSWGFKDVTQTAVSDMFRSYEDDNFRVIQYEKDGYMVRFDASVNGTALYQPVSTGIDTITGQSQDPEADIDRENYYSSEVSHYQLSFNEDGLMDLYGYWPMRSDDELHPVDHLITWDEAVESLKKAVPQHFAGYMGYSEVKFNDVRLTYFRTKTGDKQYEVIPVYVFAQLESWAEESNAPTQLIMIDARDGSEVDIMQDPARKGLY